MLSRAAGRTNQATNAVTRSFRPQAARIGPARRTRLLGLRLSWVALGAVILLMVTVADGIGQPVIPTDAAPVYAAVDPGDHGTDSYAVAAPAPPQSSAPPPVAQRAAPAVGPLDAAEAARRAGDYDHAVSLLRPLTSGQDQRMANDALLLLSVVQIEAGRPGAAADAASELMGRQLDAPGRARALFMLGRARRAGAECQAAIAAFDEVIRTAPDFGPYADLQAAYCLATLDDRAGQNARAGSALEKSEARLTKVDALEHQVSASIKLGDLPAALRASDGLLQYAATRAYRAQTLTSMGSIAKDAEQREQAIKAFATVVTELPDMPSAIGALEALWGMNAANAVAPDEAPAVLFFAGRHGEAVPALRAALDSGLSPEKAARARLYLGQSLLRLGAVDEGINVLKQVPADLPNSDLAARALYRAARSHELAGRMREAGDLYQQAAGTLPSSPAAQDSHARMVYTLMMRGAAPEALQAALALADGGSEPRPKGLGLLWASKGLMKAGDPAQASALLARAAELDVDGFGGLRARAILDGDTRGRQGPTNLDLSALQPTADDTSALANWLAARSADAATLDREQVSEPGYRRAALLYQVGMPDWAAWELQELAARWEADAARLYGLAQFAAERGDTPLSMRLALASQKAAGGPVAAQPRLLQRLIYPLPYADLIAAQAQQRSVDPLLFAGLIRQESTFNPRARSSANALGLAQVVPGTGQGIASALGRPSFSNEELYRPLVAIEFGVFYLGRQLANYDGRIYLALAAYNAGGGNANAWLAEFGIDDPDIFSEQIPFAETSHYVQVVYENYQHYRRLYR